MKNSENMKKNPFIFNFYYLFQSNLLPDNIPIS